jgi:hypothetical protein
VAVAVLLEAVGALLHPARLPDVAVTAVVTAVQAHSPVGMAVAAVAEASLVDVAGLVAVEEVVVAVAAPAVNPQGSSLREPL